jgi:hypothetical protein
MTHVDAAGAGRKKDSAARLKARALNNDPVARLSIATRYYTGDGVRRNLRHA